MFIFLTKMFCEHFEVYFACVRIDKVNISLFAKEISSCLRFKALVYHGSVFIYCISDKISTNKVRVDDQNTCDKIMHMWQNIGGNIGK